MGMKQLLMLVIALAAISGLALTSVPITTAHAVESGETIALLAEPSVAVDVSNDPNSKFIFTGEPTSTIIATGCAFPGSEGFVQQVIIKKPGDAPIHAEIIVVDQPTPIEAGTQLHTFTFVTSCFIGDTFYFRYDATVR